MSCVALLRFLSLILNTPQIDSGFSKFPEQPQPLANPNHKPNPSLEVAQPRALVILAKATSEAGELSSLVRTYIQNELRLKTEIPALRIDDAGLLLGGGESEDEDLFDNLRQTALNDNVNEPVDPDTNPTLSFTSGSEGRPKGVLGRHFSLTHYFPFMAERFGLGSNDRFTMLSGIAHGGQQNQGIYNNRYKD